MAPNYDDSFTPPPWWLALLDLELHRVTKEREEKLTLSQVAALMNAESPGKSWGGPTISKMRQGQNVTIPMAIAISRVLQIAAPVFVPDSQEESEALAREASLFRRTQSLPDAIRIGISERRVRVVDAADTAIEVLNEVTNGQIDTVQPSSEGSPRSPRTRRAPRGR